MKHMTVVYSIQDEKLFQPELARIMELFKKLAGNPWTITAVSMDHEIHRVELLEEALGDEDVDTANTILSHPNIGNVHAIEELSI